MVNLVPQPLKLRTERFQPRTIHRRLRRWGDGSGGKSRHPPYLDPTMWGPRLRYPLVNVYVTIWKDPPNFWWENMGKSQFIMENHLIFDG